MPAGDQPPGRGGPSPGAAGGDRLAFSALTGIDLPPRCSAVQRRAGRDRERTGERPSPALRLPHPEAFPALRPAKRSTGQGTHYRENKPLHREYQESLRLISVAWKAAPKPLSMLTTEMPPAQELSIDSSADRPPKLAAVADRGRHGDDRRRGQAGDDRWQRPLHARPRR